MTTLRAAARPPRLTVSDGQGLLLTGPAHLTLTGAGAADVGAGKRFLVPHNKSLGSPVLTIPGGAMVLGALYAVAYGESLLRGMRRRRSAVSLGEVAGLSGVGMVLGVVATLAAWASGRVLSGSPTGLAVLSLGAAGGLVAFAVAARREARRR
jgi:hypothetical protein